MKKGIALTLAALLALTALAGCNRAAKETVPNTTDREETVEREKKADRDEPETHNNGTVTDDDGIIREDETDHPVRDAIDDVEDGLEEFGEDVTRGAREITGTEDQHTDNTAEERAETERDTTR